MHGNKNRKRKKVAITDISGGKKAKLNPSMSVFRLLTVSYDNNTQ